MKPKMGRPKLPKGQAKAAQTGVRFTLDEDVKINDAAVAAGESMAEFVRKGALERAVNPPVWIQNCKWSKEQLDQKTIELKIRRSGLYFELPKGKIEARNNDKGQISIDVWGPCRQIPENGGIVQNRYRIFPEEASKIQPHPHPEQANFILIT